MNDILGNANTLRGAKVAGLPEVPEVLKTAWRTDAKVAAAPGAKNGPVRIN